MRVHFFRLSSRQARRPASAFTLVELLVVIGIVAVLIAILLPVLGKARAQANRTVCLSNIRQLGAGILMYCNDNDGYFPTCAYAADDLSYIFYPEDWIHWQANRNLDDSAIAKFLGRGDKLKSLLRCPADSLDGRRIRPGITPGQGPYLYSYAMNEAMGRNFKPYASKIPSKINQWRASSKKILLTETLEEQSMHPVCGFGGRLARRHGMGISRGNPLIPAGQKMGLNVSAFFLDGHAEGTNDDVMNNLIQTRPEAQ
jgi:prepilin-type N-terminal cleavage/methylation domain-containing protein